MRALIAIVALMLAHQVHGTEHPAALAQSCDRLIDAAVQRPYGWGWKAEGAQPTSSVIIDPITTARAAFVLYWAGDALDKPAYKKAAMQAAKTLCAAQLPTGQIPQRVTFFPGEIGSHDAPGLVADRTATCAAQALFLTLLDDAGDIDPRIRSSATRALTWLVRQQPANGCWPQVDGPATQPAKVVRLIRLDNRDWRNCTFTMLLAGEVLADQRATRSIPRSNNFLLRMRIGEVSQIGGALWATAYGLDTFPSAQLRDFPPGIDVLSSRLAMETLLASALVEEKEPGQRTQATGQPTPQQAFDDAATAMLKLPRYDGKWMRLYIYDVEANQPPPPPLPTGFTAGRTVIPPSRQLGDWGTTEILLTAQDYKKNGQAALVDELTKHMNLHQRLAAAMCGVEDQPFAVKVNASEPEELTTAPTLRERIQFTWKTLATQLRK